MADTELALLARFAPVRIDVQVGPDRGEIALGDPDELSDRVTIKGTADDWEDLLCPTPQPGRHDLISLGRNSPTFELPAPLHPLVRNLRVLNRWIEVARSAR
ncbi:hypothetical protein KIH31_15180 [Paenarthrobacter sp. DKR-5]|uniref:hypothetical protein n=1 Tax=Paenarthrobacter sp. DKR-5 TaxID=2835535 RepID=UPI001BDCE7E3|nr:hypothetical protein [Paenarthrobacter sp. DKR-5]MBT1003935.1 hypothetical protein [Paenarthrobacter sp. DKR-5]